MEALADKVHKQGEHIPQHCYISHNHPYISSSDTLGGTTSMHCYLKPRLYAICPTAVTWDLPGWWKVAMGVYFLTPVS